MSLKDPYVRTIAVDAQIDIHIRKSRFVGHAFRVADEDVARAKVQEVRKRYWDANHHCSAWRIGTDGKLQRSNDDGEPSGTAGMPIREVLSQRNLTDVMVVVTRYFGGIKLGAGGLIRAYGSTASAVLDAAGVVGRRPLHRMAALVEHPNAGKFQSLLRASEYQVVDVVYTDTGVESAVDLAPDMISTFAAWVADVTSGGGVVVDTGTFDVEVPVSS